MKKVRDCTKEYRIAEKAAERDIHTSEVIDMRKRDLSAYAHGYARALMDVADGKVVPPVPAYRQ